MHIYRYVCMCVCVRACVRVYVYVCRYMCFYVCTYVSIYVCVCIYIHTYTYKYRFFSSRKIEHVWCIYMCVSVRVCICMYVYTWTYLCRKIEHAYYVTQAALIPCNKWSIYRINGQRMELCYDPAHVFVWYVMCLKYIRTWAWLVGYMCMYVSVDWLMSTLSPPPAWSVCIHTYTTEHTHVHMIWSLHVRP